MALTEDRLGQIVVIEAADPGYGSLEEVTSDEKMRHLEDALRSVQAALAVVGPGFYPRYAAAAEKLADKAKEQIEERKTKL